MSPWTLLAILLFLRLSFLSCGGSPSPFRSVGCSMLRKHGIKQRRTPGASNRPVQLAHQMRADFRGLAYHAFTLHEDLQGLCLVSCELGPGNRSSTSGRQDFPLLPLSTRRYNGYVPDSNQIHAAVSSAADAVQIESVGPQSRLREVLVGRAGVYGAGL